MPACSFRFYSAAPETNFKMGGFVGRVRTRPTSSARRSASFTSNLNGPRLAASTSGEPTTSTRRVYRGKRQGIAVLRLRRMQVVADGHGIDRGSSHRGW
jgi:hypothetical protein